MLGKKLVRRHLQPAVRRVRDIDGYPTYFFDEKGHLYRFTPRGDVKLLRRTVKRYTQGYALKIGPPKRSVLEFVAATVNVT